MSSLCPLPAGQQAFDMGGKDGIFAGFRYEVVGSAFKTPDDIRGSERMVKRMTGIVRRSVDLSAIGTMRSRPFRA
jgi:hypothetical protein